jgi:AraC-like DNA-binding protein
MIRYYYETRVSLAGQVVLQPVPARSPQAIEFTFGTPYEVRRLDRATVETAHAIAVIGAQTFRRVDLVMSGTSDAFTIVFQPGAVYQLFSIPGEELANDHFEATSVLGRHFARLHQRLGDVESFCDRVEVANAYFSSLPHAFDRQSGICTAARRLLSSSGRIRPSELAQTLGLGIRQFERRFRYEVGIPAKKYARIVRFESALRQKSFAPHMTWTDIAHGLGYHDQMHMVHDFNELSGDSPMRIAGQLEMFVKPEMTCGDCTRWDMLGDCRAWRAMHGA